MNVLNLLINSNNYTGNHKLFLLGRHKWYVKWKTLYIYNNCLIFRRMLIDIHVVVIECDFFSPFVYDVPHRVM